MDEIINEYVFVEKHNQSVPKNQINPFIFTQYSNFREFFERVYLDL